MIPSTEALNTQIELLSITKKLHFPAKLFFILEFIDLYAPHLKSLFSWKHHGRCFHISDKKSFEQNIMTLFFNSTKYDTFRRQLNIWGFTRIVKVRSTNIGCYFHAKFLRGQFELCNTMVRSRASEFMKMPGNQPDFEEMPIMPATVTLSIPHFAGMAQTLSSALVDHHDETSLPVLPDCRSQNSISSKDKDANNAFSSLIQSRKRKQEIESEFHSEDKSNLYPFFESAYPAQMNLESLTSILLEGPSSTHSPYSPTASSTKDTCNEYFHGKNTFSYQQVFQTKKRNAQQVGIDHSLPVRNAIENSHTFNQAIASFSRRDLMNPATDVMPINQSFALIQMLLNQQQVDNFNSMNMIPNATTSSCPSTMDIGNIQNTMEMDNLSSSDQATTTTTMPINDSTKSSNDVPSSTSLLSLSTLEKSSRVSQELSSCNSLLSCFASNPDMMRKMKDVQLDKKNQTWSI